MQAQLVAAQEELAATLVEGSAGGGLVKATLTGSGELTALEIDPKVVDPDDIESLQDLIVAAIRDGKRVGDEMAAQTMGPLAGGMGGSLGIPGF
jgi:DNA-binding YbaB/EbfC family protein